MSNRGDFEPPALLNFDVAKHILIKIYDKLKPVWTRNPQADYAALLAQIGKVTLIPRPSAKPIKEKQVAIGTEIAMETLLGKKEAKGKVSNEFLDMFFNRMTVADRLAYFRDGFPVDFDTFLSQVRPGFRLRLRSTRNPDNTVRFHIIGLSVSMYDEKEGAPDLFHLNIPNNPIYSENGVDLSYMVHFTEEGGGKYHEWHTLYDLVDRIVYTKGTRPRQVGPAPRQVAPAPKLPPAPQVRRARGPPVDDVRKIQNFATRRAGRGRRKRTLRRRRHNQLV